MLSFLHLLHTPAHAYDAHAIANGIDTPRNFPNEDEDDVVAEAERGRAAKKRKKLASKTSRFSRPLCGTTSRFSRDQRKGASAP